MRIILLKMNYGLWPLQASQNCFHETFWPVPSPVPLETRGWGLSPTPQPSGWGHMTQRPEVGGAGASAFQAGQFQLSAWLLPRCRTFGPDGIQSLGAPVGLDVCLTALTAVHLPYIRTSLTRASCLRPHLNSVLFAVTMQLTSQCLSQLRNYTEQSLRYLVS